MRAAPIEPGMQWPGTHRQVVAQADGDLTGDIRPVEAMIGSLETGERTITVRLTLDPGDLEKLARGGDVWLTFLGVIPPFSLRIDV